MQPGHEAGFSEHPRSWDARDFQSSTSPQWGQEEGLKPHSALCSLSSPRVIAIWQPEKGQVEGWNRQVEQCESI